MSGDGGGDGEERMAQQIDPHARIRGVASVDAEAGQLVELLLC